MKFTTYDQCPICAGLLKPIGLRKNSKQGFTSGVGIYVSIVRCRNCGLTFPNPMPLPLTLNEHYDMPADDYFKSQQAGDWNKVSQAILELCGFQKSKSLHILEVGSGLGHLTHAFHQAGHHVTGIEPSETFYKQAKAQYGELFFQGTIDHFEAEKPTYLVLFNASLEHIPNFVENLKKARKSLGPSGKICVINVPNTHFLKVKMINLMLSLTLRPYVINCSPLHPPFHLWEFTAKSIDAIAKELGLNLAYCRHDTSIHFKSKTMYQVYISLLNALGTGSVIKFILENSDPTL